MPLLNIIVAAVLLFVVHVEQAGAQQPDLLGTWTAKATILMQLESGVVQAPRQMSLTFEKQDGQLVRGYKDWSGSTDDPGHIGDEKVLAAKEPFIGTISQDGQTLRLVETGDSGHMFCALIGPDELEVTYMEAAPHAVAWTAVMRRVAE